MYNANMWMNNLLYEIQIWINVNHLHKRRNILVLELVKFILGPNVTLFDLSASLTADGEPRLENEPGSKSYFGSSKELCFFHTYVNISQKLNCVLILSY